jgi:hypothetical protein
MANICNSNFYLSSDVETLNTIQAAADACAFDVKPNTDSILDNSLERFLSILGIPTVGIDLRAELINVEREDDAKLTITVNSAWTPPIAAFDSLVFDNRFRDVEVLYIAFEPGENLFETNIIERDDTYLCFCMEDEEGYRVKCDHIFDSYREALDFLNFHLRTHFADLDEAQRFAEEASFRTNDLDLYLYFSCVEYIDEPIGVPQEA